MRVFHVKQCETIPLHYVAADISDRLRSLDPVCDINWKRTTGDAAKLLVDMSRELEMLRIRADKDQKHGA
jgi:hypothetical protein